MGLYLRNIEASGIHGRFDIRQDFEDGINILVGKNGTGKTTLLHIISNALSGDFERFRYLAFNSIKLRLSDKTLLHIIAKHKDDPNDSDPIIEVKLAGKTIYSDLDETKQRDAQLAMELDALHSRDIHDREYSEFQMRRREILLRHSRRQRTELKPIIPIAYFPAFRTMIEAWAAAAAKTDTADKRRYTSDSWKDLATERARDWFGGFTPMVNFPSLVDIEQQLDGEISHARMKVWNADKTLVDEAFLHIFSSLSVTAKPHDKEETLLNNIQELFRRLEQSPLKSESRIDYSRLKDEITHLNSIGHTEGTALRVLKIYQDTLNNSLKAQTEAFKNIELYLSSVNDFLEGKSLNFKSDISSQRRSSIQTKFDDGSHVDGLRALSSGERQIVTLVYAATHMSEQQIVLIDEPEISLHVDWQRLLIKRMSEQMASSQIIACTHSPVIGSDHIERMHEVSLTATKKRFPQPTQDDGIEEPLS